MDVREASWDTGNDPVQKPSRKPWWKKVAGLLGFLLLGLIVLYAGASLLFGNFTVPTASMANTILPGDRVLVSRSPEMPGRGELVAFRFPGNRGEVAPAERQLYVKRAVASAGDTVEIRNNQLFVNGVPEKVAKGVQIPTRSFDTRAMTFPEGYDFTSDNWGPLRVPKKGDRIELATERERYAWRVFVLRDMLGSDPNLEPRQLGEVDIPSSYVVRGDYYFTMGDNRGNALDSRFWGFVPETATFGRPLIVYLSIDDDGGIRGDRMFMTIE